MYTYCVFCCHIFLQLSLMSQFFFHLSVCFVFSRPDLTLLHIDVYADYLFCCFSPMYFAFFGICYLCDYVTLHTLRTSYVSLVCTRFNACTCVSVFDRAYKKKSQVRGAHGNTRKMLTFKTYI